MRFDKQSWCATCSAVSSELVVVGAEDIGSAGSRPTLSGPIYHQFAAVGWAGLCAHTGFCACTLHALPWLTMPESTLVVVPAAAPKKPRQRVHKLSALIAEQRSTLEAWETVQRRAADECRAPLAVLRNDAYTIGTQWICAVDRLYRTRRWSPIQQEFLSVHILEEAAEMMKRGIQLDPSSEAMTIALAHQARLADARDAPREAASEQEQEGEAKSWQETLREAIAARTGERVAEPPNPATARTLYRKLAGALHPDREADPAVALAKTELLTQVNLAYADEDAHALLELAARAAAMPGVTLDLDALSEADVARTLTAQLKALQTKILDAQYLIRDAFLVRRLAARPTSVRISTLVRNRMRFAHEQHARYAAQKDVLADEAALTRWLIREAHRYSLDAA